MKLKYYLRGLGLGIIFTSIILAVAYSQNKGLMTDSEVKKRASELGMVSTESESSDLFNQNDTEIQGTDEQGGELVDQPQDSEQSQAGDSQLTGDSSSQQGTAQQPEESTSQQGTAQQPEVGTTQQEPVQEPDVQIPQQDDNAQQSVNNTSEQVSSEEPEYIVITVVPGEVCRQIAEDLQAHGLVDDAESFRKYMQEKDYDNLIRVGKFPIKKGATYEEIAISLTTKQ